MLQAQTYVYVQNGLAVLGIRNTHFLLFLSPLSSLVACELFVSMNVISRKQLKLSKLYATFYHSLCRCLIPPLYTMFMPTTFCRIKYFFECFRWLLYAVLCRFIPMRWQFHTLLYTALCQQFSLIHFSIIYSKLFLAVLASMLFLFFVFEGSWSYFQILWRFLRRLRSFSSQKTPWGPILGQNKISKKTWKLV